MLDLLLRGGSIVDGTGQPAERGDVGIRDGRIVAVGHISEPSRRTLDVSERVVAPGFIDIHTHYDAQLTWDPYASPSSLHGVTTVLCGNCGFSIAPLKPEAVDYITAMLARVEGIPLDALQRGVHFSWSSFGEYLNSLDGHLGVNAGFLVGHSAVRVFVMGADAFRRTATEDEVQAMVQVLADSIVSGGLGLSSSGAPSHNDGEGLPVPSRWASTSELLTLAAEVSRHEGTTVEYVPAPGLWSEETTELLIDLSLTSRRPVNWNLLSVSAEQENLTRTLLDTASTAANLGARELYLLQFQTSLSFSSISSLEPFWILWPGWDDLFRKSIPDRIAWLKVPENRKQLVAGAAQAMETLPRFSDLSAFTVVKGWTPSVKVHEGKTIAEIARSLDKSPGNTLFDLVIEDELRTTLMSRVLGDDERSWELRREVWADSRTVLGGSDAGAHLDMITTFGFTSKLLGEMVRDRGLMTLEGAIHEITERPAALYGLRDRGTIAVGSYADLVVFDPARIGVGPVETRSDMPGGSARLFAEAIGVDQVFVNGVAIVESGQLTQRRPGRVLRSGIDTSTVLVGSDA